MSETMKMGLTNYSGQKSDYFSHFPSLCKEIWTSAERMAWDLADHGVDITLSACKSYRSGKTEPRLSTGVKIIEIMKLKSEQEIQAARSRIAALT